jgi:AcrR family transcriptional regulator
VTGTSERTRAAILNAAEALMARRGIEAVDLQDIRIAAGQRNRSVVAYHFTDRAGLVEAINNKHRGPLNEERTRLLDKLEADGVTLEGLVDAAVTPLAKSLETESGRDYLCIVGEAAARIGTAGHRRTSLEHSDSTRRLVELLYRQLDGPPAARRTRVAQVILAMPVLLADIARGISRGDITQAQGKRRVPGVRQFLLGALEAPF